MSENEQAVVELKAQSGAVLTWARDVFVETKVDADAAMSRLSELKGIRQKWVSYWKPLKDAAKAAHSAICGKENEGTAIIDDAERIVKGKVLAWQQAERAKAEEAQRKAQAAADEEARRERDRLVKEAARLKTPEKKQERLEQAAAVAAPVIMVAAPVVEACGSGVRTTWKAECVDMAALIAAAVPGSLAASFLVFDQKAADAFARATKGATKVAGVAFKPVESLSVRI